MVPVGSRVLDLGCGDGALLAHLIAERACDGHGIEIDGDDVLACIAAGVPVSEGDIEDALRDFADGAFDVVLLSWTLQTTRRPKPRSMTRRPRRRYTPGRCGSPFRAPWRASLGKHRDQRSDEEDRHGDVEDADCAPVRHDPPEAEPNQKYPGFGRRDAEQPED